MESISKSSVSVVILNSGLVDELSLVLHLILLSGGKTLFSGIKDRVHLTLVESKTYDAGLISLTYLIRKK
jgi:dihydrofolate reductase